jgi:hypothetical protein
MNEQVLGVVLSCAAFVAWVALKDWTRKILECPEPVTMSRLMWRIMTGRDLGRDIELWDVFFVLDGLGSSRRVQS